MINTIPTDNNASAAAPDIIYSAIVNLSLPVGGVIVNVAGASFPRSTGDITSIYGVSGFGVLPSPIVLDASSTFALFIICSSYDIIPMSNFNKTEIQFTENQKFFIFE